MGMGFTKSMFGLSLCLSSTVFRTSGQVQFIFSRLPEEIRFDGIVDEPVWDDIQPLPMVIHTPVFGKEPAEKTEARIAYTDENIFISARLFDREPDRIMSTSKK